MVKQSVSSSHLKSKRGRRKPFCFFTIIVQRGENSKNKKKAIIGTTTCQIGSHLKSEEKEKPFVLYNHSSKGKKQQEQEKSKYCDSHLSEWYI